MAQSTPSSSAATQRPHRRQMPGGERSMKGCLSKDSSGNYFLLLARGRKVPLNTTGDIASHVGQQVRINGAFIDAPEGAASSPDSGNNSQSSVASSQHPVREFRVLKVDMLSASCTAAPTKPK